MLLPISGVLAHVGSSPAVEAPATWLNVFLFFLKIGSVLYGSGYVLLAFLQRELERNQWLPSNFWMQLPLVSSRLVLCLPQRPSLSASGQCWGACRNGGIFPLLFWWA